MLGRSTKRSATALALLSVAGAAWANEAGRSLSIEVACAAAGCHAPAAGYGYSVSVSMPATRLETVEPVAVEVSWTVANDDPGNPASGFGWNIAAAGGELAVPSGDLSQRLERGELVHTERMIADVDGGGAFRAIWTVPGVSGEYALRYCVLPVNGDGAPSADGPARCGRSEALSVVGRPPAPGLHFIVLRDAAAPTRLALVERAPARAYENASRPAYGTLFEACPDAPADDPFYAPCYRSDPGYVGHDEFVYRVVDERGRASTGRVTIAVADPAAPPTGGAAGWALWALASAGAARRATVRRRP